MTYRGMFKNGVVVFNDPPLLREGAAVEVAPLESSEVPVQISPPRRDLADFLEISSAVPRACRKTWPKTMIITSMGRANDDTHHFEQAGFVALLK